MLEQEHKMKIVNNRCIVNIENYLQLYFTLHSEVKGILPHQGLQNSQRVARYFLQV